MGLLAEGSHAGAADRLRIEEDGGHGKGAVVSFQNERFVALFVVRPILKVRCPIIAVGMQDDDRHFPSDAVF
jgi:hypothetical protein